MDKIWVLTSDPGDGPDAFDGVFHSPEQALAAVRAKYPKVTFVLEMQGSDSANINAVIGPSTWYYVTLATIGVLV